MIVPLGTILATTNDAYSTYDAVWNSLKTRAWNDINFPMLIHIFMHNKFDNEHMYATH
jgi:hypothetical protein